MKLNRELASKAKKLNICKPWYEMLRRAEDKDTMMRMYVTGIDFCLSNDFPSVEYLEKHGQGVSEKHGVYVNKKAFDLHNSPFTVLLGTSKAVIRHNECHFGQLFIKHTAVVDITLTDDSFTVIDAFDNSIVIGTASGNARVLINKYGNPRVNILATENAQIKIIDKQASNY